MDKHKFNHLSLIRAKSFWLQPEKVANCCSRQLLFVQTLLLDQCCFLLCPAALLFCTAGVSNLSGSMSQMSGTGSIPRPDEWCRAGSMARLGLWTPPPLLVQDQMPGILSASLPPWKQAAVLGSFLGCCCGSCQIQPAGSMFIPELYRRPQKSS